MGTDMTDTNIANQESRQSIKRREDFEQFAKYLGLDYDDYIAFYEERVIDFDDYSKKNVRGNFPFLCLSSTAD